MKQKENPDSRSCNHGLGKEKEQTVLVIPERKELLTFVVPLDLGVSCHDGAYHTGLCLVGFVICLGAGGRHVGLIMF